MTTIAAALSWTEIDRDQITGGAELKLYRRDDAYMIRADGLELMTSSTSGSERQLVHEALKHVDVHEVRSVLIGGLGLGFTLSEACCALSKSCRITAIEISPKVKDWVGTYMAHTTGPALKDPRVSIIIADFCDYLAQTKATYDLILSDIDNGPHAFVTPGNDDLYKDAGLAQVKENLSAGGCVVFWSGSDEPEFRTRLAQHFQTVKTHTYTLPQAPNIKQYLFVAFDGH